MEIFFIIALIFVVGFALVVSMDNVYKSISNHSPIATVIWGICVIASVYAMFNFKEITYYLFG